MIFFLLFFPSSSSLYECALYYYCVFCTWIDIIKLCWEHLFHYFGQTTIYGRKYSLYAYFGAWKKFQQNKASRFKLQFSIIFLSCQIHSINFFPFFSLFFASFPSTLPPPSRRRTMNSKLVYLFCSTKKEKWKRRKSIVNVNELEKLVVVVMVGWKMGMRSPWGLLLNARCIFPSTKIAWKCFISIQALYAWVKLFQIVFSLSLLWVKLLVYAVCILNFVCFLFHFCISLQRKNKHLIFLYLQKLTSLEMLFKI